MQPEVVFSKKAKWFLKLTENWWCLFYRALIVSVWREKEKPEQSQEYFQQTSLSAISDKKCMVKG